MNKHLENLVEFIKILKEFSWFTFWSCFSTFAFSFI